MDEVFHSGFQVESLTFDPQGERVFLRLQFADIPTYDAWNDDFNGNGVSNEDDVATDSDPLAPVPGGAPAPEDTPLVPNHAYTLTVTQTGGDGAGDRVYYLDWFFNLLTVDQATHEAFPITIARSPAGVETKLKLRALKEAPHERKLDFLLYQSNTGDVSGETYREVIKQPSLEITRNQQEVESAVTEVKTTSYKRREIVVNVYPIASVVDQVDANGQPVLDGSGNPVPAPNPKPPNPLPTQAALQSFLDRVFLKQMNLKCQVIVHPVAPVQWDVAVAPDRLGQDQPTVLPNHLRWPFENDAERPKRGDGIFHREKPTGPEQTALVNSRALAPKEVHVFLIGGCPKMYEVALGNSGQMEYVNHGSLNGFADVPSWHAFLRGDLTVEMGGENAPGFVKEQVLKSLISTIAHEVGHVVVGLGHPDNPNVTMPSEAGVAPLARSPVLHAQRIMVSGGAGTSPEELVWKEWENGRTRLDVFLSANN